MSEEEAHHVHQIHHYGAILSIIIAFSGIFLAYSMYVKKSLNPAWWTGTFKAWTEALKTNTTSTIFISKNHSRNVVTLK